MSGSGTQAAWERFAEVDALRFIDPAMGRHVTVEAFRAGGAALVDEALGWVGELPGRDRVVEIGCGVGRNLVHLARHFARADGIDVSPAMLDIAEQCSVPANVRLHATSGATLSPVDTESTDLVFSHLVFQHVEDPAAIAANLSEIHRVLRPGGAAALQFDTRPASRLADLVHHVPDPLLPELHRSHIRRYRRPAELIRSWIGAAELEVERERGPGTALHWFVLRRGAA